MKLFLQILIIFISLIIISCSETSEDINRVITCTTIDDCPSTFDCIDGFCKPNGENDPTEECIDDTECPGGFYCNGLGECEQKICESKADCEIGKVCIGSRCIDGCETNSDCENNETCDTLSHLCVKAEDCRIEDNCEQGYDCDQLSGKCVAKLDCITSEDCATGYKCDNSQCITKVGCHSNEECANGEVCRADGYCDIDTGCDGDQYCINKNPEKPACSTNSGMCYECTSNEHCRNLDKPICNTMTHVCGTEEGPSEECQIDSDCGLNKKCNTATSPHECIDMMTTCSNDNDCQNGMHCNTSNGRCVMCLDNSQCTSPKVCNPNTNLCEEEGSSGGGEGNNICTDLGFLMCLLANGVCSDGLEGDCIISETDPCDGVSCPTNSTCNEGYCDCDTGYHLNADDECAENETCTGFSCPQNSHCELDNNEAGCYCNDGYNAVDTDNDGKKDTCLAEDLCEGVTCSNHGSCIESNGEATCNCDVGYHVNGLYCILDSQTCDLDQFSTPLNNTSSMAKSIDFGTYNDLTLSNSNCHYVEDWYKIQLYSSTEFKFTLTYADTDSNITVKLYKQGDTATPVASNTSTTNTRSISYNVAEESTYYIRVYIYYQAEQRAIPYSMTLSSRAIQSGNPGAECSSDNQCYGENATCANYTSNGYCSNTCASNGDTCMDTGVCMSNNCFKQCTIGSDASCSRNDLVCSDFSGTVGGICIKKCYSNDDCESNICKTNTGHCAYFMDCNPDNPLDDGCSSSEFCIIDDATGDDLCYPTGTKTLGDPCEYLSDCIKGLGCIGNEEDGYACQEYCIDSYDCGAYEVCSPILDKPYGYCN